MPWSSGSSTSFSMVVQPTSGCLRAVGVAAGRDGQQLRAEADAPHGSALVHHAAHELDLRGQERVLPGLRRVHRAAEADEARGLVRPRGQLVGQVDAAHLERHAEVGQRHGDAAGGSSGSCWTMVTGFGFIYGSSPGRTAVCPTRGGIRHLAAGFGTRLARPPHRLQDWGHERQHPHAGPVDPPTGAPIVEIVSAGNEVLIGDVLDTNTNWLCTRVTALGGLVRRTVMLRDDVQAIGAELRGCLARRPALIFTVGGLGPTSDDRTLEGVALGLGVPLELHAEAERMVAAKYEEFFAAGYVPFPELNDNRRKMARLPAGAEPLVNPIGGAPGVLLPQRRDPHRLASRRARRAQGDRRRVDRAAGGGDLRRRPLRGALARGGACRTSRRSPTSCAPRRSSTRRCT